MIDVELKKWLFGFAADAKLAWPEIKSSLELVALMTVSIAAIMGMFRLRTIARVVKDFRHSEGPIQTIQNAAKELQKFGQMEPVVRALGEELKLLGEKIDAAQQQVAEQQRLVASERTEAAPQEVLFQLDTAIPDAPATSSIDAALDTNWLELREIWYRNTSRIEAKINSISDGRRKLKYDRIPRYQYNPIISALERDGQINPAVAAAFIELNSTFLRYKPRNRPVPDEIVGVMRVLDRQLEFELAGNPPPQPSLL